MWNYVIMVMKPEGPIEIYKLPEDMDSVTEEVLDKVRTEQSVPENWSEIDGWQFSISQGEPHSSILKTATIHEWVK